MKNEIINTIKLLLYNENPTLLEKVAALHLAKLGVELETLRDDQAKYIGVPVEGPYKPEYYRY